GVDFAVNEIRMDDPPSRPLPRFHPPDVVAFKLDHPPRGHFGALPPVNLDQLARLNPLVDFRLDLVTPASSLPPPKRVFFDLGAINHGLPLKRVLDSITHGFPDQLVVLLLNDLTARERPFCGVTRLITELGVKPKVARLHLLSVKLLRTAVHPGRL